MEGDINTEGGQRCIHGRLVSEGCPTCVRLAKDAKDDWEVETRRRIREQGRAVQAMTRARDVPTSEELADQVAVASERRAREQLAATRVIVAALVAIEGGSRVQGVRPDEVSLPMGSGGGGYEEWAIERLRDALAIAPASSRPDLQELLVSVYLDGRRLESFGRFWRLIALQCHMVREKVIQGMTDHPWRDPSEPAM